MNNSKIYLSIILPVYNEEDNILLQYEDVIGAVKSIKKSYEIIFIDDGSTDKSYAILSDIAKKNKHVKIIKIPKFRKSVPISTPCT